VDLGRGGGQTGTVAGSIQALRFPLPILIPPPAPHSLRILTNAIYLERNTDCEAHYIELDIINLIFTRLNPR
jgi:hypothetical protein